MPHVDQFESIFRSAVKDILAYQHISVSSVLLITDLEGEAAQAFQSRVQAFLSILANDSGQNFFLINGNEFDTTGDLLKLVEQHQPDMLCSYRNLHSRAWRFPHSLGEHLDVLLQQTSVPVMVLPHPEADYQAEHALQDTRQVMVVTDLNAVNDPLINYAAAFTSDQGTLYLAHVEDQDIFERYMDVISKIDIIDTDTARNRLREQLLKEPEDYFHSCADILERHGASYSIQSLVRFGHPVEEYRRLIHSQKLDLLVLSAKDERQHAMHSIAYPLAVELRQIPLLML